MTALDDRIGDAIDRSRLADLASGIVARPKAEREPVLAPFTGEPIADVPLSTTDDVASAFDAAREAQRSWAARPVQERARIVGAIHDLMLDRRGGLADLVQLETGKARRDAFEEVADVALAARYVARRGPSILRDRRRVGAIPGLTRAIEARQPKGVVGVISPWNYPLTLAISDSLPAFVAGNAVVHKPDIQTMFTALRVREIAVEAGLPDGLWQVVCGDGPSIGGAVVGGADCVSFTGSTAVGRLVAAQAGERLVSASLELGGKNPMLVLDDADLDRAAEGAVRACFSTAGQLCISMERLYIADSVYDEFVSRLTDRVNAMVVGAKFDYSCDMGSLMSQAQLEKVSAHVDDAVAKGAEPITGGKARPDLGPWFYEPTVLSRVQPGMRLADEETFGPVVSLYRFVTDDEAIDLANQTEFGLNASVWSRNSKRAIAVAKRLRSGMVNVNEGYIAGWASHDLPMGGMKQSGLGRRHGREGILRYTESQAIAVQRVMGIAPPGSMTYDTFARLLSGSLRALKRIGRP